MRIGMHVAGLLVASALVATIAGVLQASPASAEVKVIDSPSTRQEAEQRANAICDLKEPVGFGVWPSDITFDDGGGTITYKINIVWRACNGTETRAYAVTGYPANGLNICPQAGDYYDGSQYNPQTYDCIKYVGSYRAGETLSCSRWEPNPRRAAFNDACFTGYPGVAGGVGLTRVRTTAGQPSGDWSVRSYWLRGEIPRNLWTEKTKTSGEWNFGGYGAICQYFNTLQGRQWRPNADQRCQNFIIRASWIRYNFKLTPTIQNITDGSIIELPKSTYQVKGNVHNAGPTQSKNNTEWRITMARYAPGVTPNKAAGTSSGLPCSFFKGYAACDNATGSGTRKDGYDANTDTGEETRVNLSNYPLGTQLCFAMSVRQYSHDSDDWSHSSLHCHIIAKQPKVTILGGDLFVGRAAPGLKASSSKITTSVTVNNNGTFGSWGEYALVSTGPITSMASGSAYVGGAPVQTDLLSFVNSDNTDRCAKPVGCYVFGKNFPDLSSRFRTSSQTPILTSGSVSGVNAGVYRATSSLEIEASTMSKSQWIVVNAPTQNVTIKGDIRYAEGPYDRVSQIPQLIIIANTITINEGVERVDAWLVAPGRLVSGKVTGGEIRTCNLVPSEIRDGVCSKRLTVNGPIIANRLVMLRTGGAGPGSAAGDPAEVFNFRADALLWGAAQASSGGRVTTVTTKELPPRY